MALFHRLRVWLVAVGVIHLALPLRAAELDRKYLLDDSHLVVTVNVQKGLETPAFKKHFQQQTEGLLKMDGVQEVLRDLGCDPLKEVSRITLVMGLSSYKDEPQVENGQIVGFDSQGGPLVIVEGRFDAAKLEAKARQFFKELKVHEIGSRKLFEANIRSTPVFAALADPKTLILGRFKDQVAEALDKADGKKKTQISSKVMAGLLDKLDADQVVAAAVSGDMVAGSSTTVANNVATVHHHTIKEQAGIDSLLVSLRLADDLKSHVTISVTDADKARQMAKDIEVGIQLMIDRVKSQIEDPKQRIPAKLMAPWLNALKAIKVSCKESAIFLETQVPAQLAADLVQSYFAMRQPAPPPVPNDD